MVRRLIRKLGEREGFTLIELLVVVAILALLAAIAAPKIGDVITKSKDARKRADMKVISGALERYFNDKGQYPKTLAELQFKGYLKQDFDFRNGYGFHYFYAVDSTADPQHYALGDPGRNPLTSGTAIYTAVTAGTENHTQPTPAGVAPNQTAFWWKSGTGGGTQVTLVKLDGTIINASNAPPSLVQYCEIWDATTTSCASGSQPRPFRFDIISD